MNGEVGNLKKEKGKKTWDLRSENLCIKEKHIHSHQIPTSFDVPKSRQPQFDGGRTVWPAFKSRRITDELAIILEVSFRDHHKLWGWCSKDKVLPIYKWRNTAFDSVKYHWMRVSCLMGVNEVKNIRYSIESRKIKQSLKIHSVKAKRRNHNMTQSLLTTLHILEMLDLHCWLSTNRRRRWIPNLKTPFVHISIEIKSTY